MNNDTIAALATPKGIGAIGVIRVSGSESIKIVDALFKGTKSLKKTEARKVLLGYIIDKETTQTIDQVLVVKFVSPFSYTGEDMVEIHCHGGRVVVSEILKLLIAYGARVANPGEFTQRAFLNGKIDLLQAEAVADIIQAQTSAALKASQRQLEGELSKKLLGLKEEIKETVALLELSLDFTEEDITFFDRESLKKKIVQTIDTIEQLIKGFRYGRIIKEGLLVVLAGKPNVGKSSILNRLIQKEKAIVSDIPGTTRDSIEEWIDLDGYWIRITDTAGIIRSEGIIERKAEEKTLQAIKNADLILFVTDGSNEYEEEDEKALRQIKQISKADVLLLRNKMDLGLKTVNDKLRNEFEECVSISAKTGDGFDELEQAIIKRIKELPHNGEVISNIRHYEELLRAKEELEFGLKAAEENYSEEYISVHLMESLKHIGKLTGEITADEILNHIFSRFCIGK